MTSVLVALTIVANGAIRIPLSMGLEIRFGFVFLSTIAFLFGPTVTFAAGFITSVLAFLLFPAGFPFDPRFDLNAGLAGFIYAMFLYRRNYKSEYFIVWIVCSKIVVNFVCNIVINTILLRGYIGSFADIVTITRIFKNVMLLPGEIVVMLIVIKYVAAAAQRYKFVKLENFDRGYGGDKDKSDEKEVQNT